MVAGCTSAPDGSSPSPRATAPTASTQASAPAPTETTTTPAVVHSTTSTTATTPTRPTTTTTTLGTQTGAASPRPSRSAPTSASAAGRTCPGAPAGGQAHVSRWWVGTPSRRRDLHQPVAIDVHSLGLSERGRAGCGRYTDRDGEAHRREQFRRVSLRPAAGRDRPGRRSVDHGRGRRSGRQGVPARHGVARHTPEDRDLDADCLRRRLLSRPGSSDRVGNERRDRGVAEVAGGRLASAASDPALLEACRETQLPVAQQAPGTHLPTSAGWGNLASREGPLTGSRPP